MGGFIIIPDFIMNDKNLNVYEKMLMSMTIALSQKNDCFAGNEFFAEKLGLRQETISRYLKNLEQKQYLKINYEFSGTKVKKRTMLPLINNQWTVDSKSMATVDLKSKIIINDINNKYNNNTKKIGFKNYTEQTTEKDLENIKRIYEKYGGKNETT